MYFDEDGDLAHEFYEEVILGGACPRSAMRRRRKNLRPQVGETCSVPLLYTTLTWQAHC